MDEPGAMVPIVAMVLAFMPHIFALSKGLVVEPRDVAPFGVEIGVVCW